MALTDFLAKLVGGSVGDAVDKIVHTFKADPTVVAQNAEEIEKIKLELEGKLQDAVANEITQSADVIKAEAQSQSWLPRNVRPLLLLLWGVALTLNQIVPVFSRYWYPAYSPLPVPDWLFKLTAIGFTGYVTARTWEKVTDSDS